jgi:hypothetical protein
MGEELHDRGLTVRPAVLVRVSVQITKDDEHGFGGQPAPAALIVDQVRCRITTGDVVCPEPDLVERTPAVAVLRAVEHRRRRMRREQMHDAVANVHRYVPVTFTRQAQCTRLVR